MLTASTRVTTTDACRYLTIATPEYAVPMEAGVYASTLTHPDAGGGHGASDYTSTLTTAPVDGHQRRGVAGLGSGGQSSSA